MEQQSRLLSKRSSLVEGLLAVLFLFAPFYFHPNLGGTGLNLPANIVIWMLATSIIFLGVKQALDAKVLYLPKYYYYILAFPVLITLSGFIAGVLYPLDWFFRLAFVWMGAAFFIALLQFKQTRGRYDRYLFYILLSAILQAVTGLAHKYQLGFVADLLPPLKSGDPFGMFFQINNQNSYQVTAILIAFYLLTRPLSRSSQVIRVMLYLGIFLASIIVAISASRIGALALLIVIPILIRLLWPKFKIRRKQLAFAVLILFTGIALGGVQGYAKLSDKTTRLADGYGADERLGIYAISLSLIEKSPVWGHGIGSFIPKWHEEKILFIHDDPQFETISSYLTHPHNEVMLWAVEGGMIALVGFIFVLLFLYKTGRLHYQQWPVMVLLLPIVLHTQVELPFYTSALHWFVVLLLLSMLSTIQLAKVTLSLSHTMHNTLKVSNYLLALLTGLFLVHTLISCYELGSYRGSSWNIKIAASNPYFSEIVESMQHKELAIYANNNKNMAETERFLDWGRRHIIKEPSPPMYQLMAMAYNNLKQRTAMCQLVAEGVLLYPDHKDLKAIDQKCTETK